MIKEATHYRLTTYSCFAGIFVQAVAANITPILFIPFLRLYGFNYSQLGFLVTVNFFAQLAVDIAFSKAIDHFGFRKMVLPATLFAVAGLMLFALTPFMFKDVYTGVLLSTVLFSMAAGILEITLSPIIDAIPNTHKGPAMALMHSFYAWGQVAVILLTTLFIYIYGIQKWYLMVFFWSIVPLTAFVMFYYSEFPQEVHESKRIKISVLFRNKFYIVALFAIMFGGATEVTMNQWASSFMEKGLELPKATGDLAGMAGFAVMLGLGRLFYGKLGAKIDLNRILIFSSFMSLVCYLVVVFSGVIPLSVFALAACGLFSSLLWPGTLVVTAGRFPGSGSWIFAILAAAGDIGAGTGPWLTGAVTNRLLGYYLHYSEQTALRGGLLAAAIFPLGALLCHIYLRKRSG